MLTSKKRYYFPSIEILSSSFHPPRLCTPLPFLFPLIISPFSILAYFPSFVFASFPFACIPLSTFSFSLLALLYMFASLHLSHIPPPPFCLCKRCWFGFPIDNSWIWPFWWIVKRFLSINIETISFRQIIKRHFLTNCQKALIDEL